MSDYFNNEDIERYKKEFNAINVSKTGAITSGELKKTFQKVGEFISDEKVEELIKEVDSNMDGKIQFEEFLDMLKKIKQGVQFKAADILKKASKKLVTMGSATGGAVHSYSLEEAESFSEFINDKLSDDKDLKHLGFPIKGTKLFDFVKDGMLLCKLVNVAVPETIDERTINKIKAGKELNPWQRNENHNLMINSAKAIGCVVVNVQNEFLNEGRPSIVLGMVWQIIRIGLTQAITLNTHPELARLLKEGETLEQFLKLPPEEILIRWVNYQMDQANHKRHISNFAGDIKDSEVYTVLLNQISPNHTCSKDALKENDKMKRAEKMLGEADKIQCKKFVSAKDVVNGISKLNFAFVANLFNSYPCLQPIKKEDYDFAGLLDFDTEGSREERSFRYWVQSLGFDCNNLYDDFSDGVLMLKIFEKLDPKSVDLKKINQKPKNKFQKVENCNYAIEVGKKIGLSTTNIGGADIFDKNKKLILGIVWQQMRASLIQMLKELGGGKKIEEKEIIEWANSKVSDAKISSFQDKSLGTGVFLCKLCKAVAPNSVDESVITGGDNEKEKEMNAKYAISVARKLGAVVFLLFEDIIEVKPKMLLSFIASLMIVDLKKK